MKVLVLFVRYGEDRYPEALNRLNSFYTEKLGPEVQYDLVVIDNSLPRDFSEERAGYLLIAGDNSRREFSGWNTGLSRFEDSLSRYDLIHFVTSAFGELYTGYLDDFSATALKRVVTGDWILGHLDRYPDDVELNGVTSCHWVRTCFFFLKPSRVRSLGSLVSNLKPEDLFSGDPESPFLPEAPISRNYRQYIMDWLTGTGYDEIQWHSVFSLNRETFENFKAKTLTILDEHSLRIRLASAGCPAVDIGWLKSTDDPSRKGVESVLGGPEQIAVRNKQKGIHT